MMFVFVCLYMLLDVSATYKNDEQISFCSCCQHFSRLPEHPKSGATAPCSPRARFTCATLKCSVCAIFMRVPNLVSHFTRSPQSDNSDISYTLSV